MQVTTDDSLRRVDARWLGVPGWTFPWAPTRYNAYALGAPIFLVVLWAMTRFAPMGIWTVIYGLVIAVFITTRLMRMVDDERPSSTIAPLVWGELGAPRSSRHSKSHQCTWNLQAVPIFTLDAAGRAELLHRPTSSRRLRRRRTREVT